MKGRQATFYISKLSLSLFKDDAAATCQNGDGNSSVSRTVGEQRRHVLNVRLAYLEISSQEMPQCLCHFPLNVRWKVSSRPLRRWGQTSWFSQASEEHDYKYGLATTTLSLAVWGKEPWTGTSCGVGKLLDTSAFSSILGTWTGQGCRFLACLTEVLWRQYLFHQGMCESALTRQGTM